MESIYFDSNVWNLLFENKINMRDQFPSKSYKLKIIHEQTFENQAINDNELRKFIEESISSWGVEVDRYFGHLDKRHVKDEQRVGGYNVGRFAHLKETEFMREYKDSLGDKKRKSRLYANEADLALAARSAHSVVLTLDRKKGPLLWASKKRYKVVFLNEFDGNTQSLYEFVRKKC